MKESHLMEVLMADVTSKFVSTKETYWIKCKDTIVGDKYSGPCQFGFTDKSMFVILPFATKNWNSQTKATFLVDFYSIEKI